MANYNDEKPPFKVLLGILGVLVLAIFAVTASFKLAENLDNKEIMVIQAPFSGKLTVYTTGGTKWQGWGTVTKYKKSFQYWFDGKEGHNPAIPIKFYDGGHAAIPGSVRVDLPLDAESMVKLHTKYGGQEAIEEALIEQVLIKSISMSGPTMTSKESYAEKKNDLLYFVEDQASFGIYKTKPRDVKVIDPITNQERIATVVDIIPDSANHGQPLRQEKSLVSEMNIKLFNLSFGDFAYDDIVKKQIAMQQDQAMKVQTGIANAKRAEQDAITVEQEGKASAAEAKWAQEVVKAQAVTEAQQQKEVAALNAQTAILNAQKVKTEAEAQSYKNQKLVSAGLTPQERAEWDYKTKVGVAHEISGITLPGTYMAGNSGGGNASMLESILGVKLLNLGKD